MIFRHYVLLGLSGLLIVLLSMNFYFITSIVNNSILPPKSRMLLKNSYSENYEMDSKVNYTVKSRIKIAEYIENQIKEDIRTLPSKYFRKNVSSHKILENIFFELKVSRNISSNINKILENWPSPRQLIPSPAPELGTIIQLLRNSRIIKADNSKVGTQLKLILTFKNGIKALFKPMWYNRTTKIKGLVYFGKDRHNAEVAAFYLALLLSFRRVPLALIRKLNLKEDVLANATPELLSTIYQAGENTCFYGTCHYCSPVDPICGIEDKLEGAIILWLPPNWKLIKRKHPWQRTYTKNRIAPWEIDTNYCNKVKASKTYSLESSSILLDLIDTAIFDFLIDNGDRHHYELFQGKFSNPAVLLIDNGKSLGDPDIDHIDILAPLYQCCLMRRRTWQHLQLLSGGFLSYALKQLIEYESSLAQVLPLVTDEHLSAIDRRLLTIYTVVEFCFKKKHFSKVIID